MAVALLQASATRRRAVALRALPIGALVVLMLGAWSSDASAEVRLRPAADGSLGAWLVAGSVTQGSAVKLDPGALLPEKDSVLPGSSARWRVASHADGALDLARLLGSKSGFAALGGWLEVESPVEALLLLGADGGASVWLDGERVFQRKKPALRGAAFEPIALSLPSGSHRLVLWLENALPHFAVWVRLISQADGLPPAGVSLRLPQTDAADAKQLAKSLLVTSLTAHPSPSGYRPELTFAFPRGYPESLLQGEPARPLVTLHTPGAPAPLQLGVGSLPDATRGLRDLSVQLPSPGAAKGELRVDVELGGERRSLKTRVEPAVTLALGAAAAQLNRLSETPAAATAAPTAAPSSSALSPGVAPGTPSWVDPDVVRATLEWRSAELVRAVDSADSRAAAAALRELEQLTQSVAAGKDPLVAEGVQHLASRSALDASPQPLAVHFPRGYASRSPDARFPLVLLLHGYTGNPASVMRAFLDSASDQPRVNGIVLAPHAHGDAFYRDAGEAATLASLEWALSTLPVDPERVTVTGVSMGGTGVGYMALRYPDRFSAASPLCGYHSYFIRRDTSKRPIRAWERDRMHHWSPASWAENGRHVPMFVAQGTKDFPHENSKVLIKRYRDLGYAISEEWPETGHNVWDKVWRDAAMWSWLSTKQRVKLPEVVTLTTDALRYGKRYWVEITGLTRSGPLATLHAEAKGKQLRFKTSGVSEFRLVPPLPHGIAGDEVALSVDGDSVRLRVGATPTTPIVRVDGHWQVSEPSPAADPALKVAGVEGPIRDVFMRSTVFVYGTRRAATSRATRELALSMARRTPDLLFPVVADTQITPKQRAEDNLVLVGGAADNLVSYSVRGQLKSRVAAGKLSMGRHEFSGEDVAAIYIQPNPVQPTRYLVVIDAVSAMGFYLTPMLPQLLPDYLIYDRGVAPATSQQVLGAAQVLAGGFFDRRWQIPADAGVAGDGGADAAAQAN